MHLKLLGHAIMVIHRNQPIKFSGIMRVFNVTSHLFEVTIGFIKFSLNRATFFSQNFKNSSRQYLSVSRQRPPLVKDAK